MHKGVHGRIEVGVGVRFKVKLKPTQLILDALALIRFLKIY